MLLAAQGTAGGADPLTKAGHKPPAAGCDVQLLFPKETVSTCCSPTVCKAGTTWTGALALDKSDKSIQSIMQRQRIHRTGHSGQAP